MFFGYFSWLANPVLAIAYGFVWFKKFYIAAGLGVVATGLVLSTFSMKSMVVNEGGTKAAVTGYHVGFWLWLLSCLVVLIGSVAMIVAPMLKGET